MWFYSIWPPTSFVFLRPARSFPSICKCTLGNNNVSLTSWIHSIILTSRVSEKPNASFIVRVETSRRRFLMEKKSSRPKIRSFYSNPSISFKWVIKWCTESCIIDGWAFENLRPKWLKPLSSLAAFWKITLLLISRSDYISNEKPLLRNHFRINSASSPKKQYFVIHWRLLFTMHPGERCHRKNSLFIKPNTDKKVYGPREMEKQTRSTARGTSIRNLTREWTFPV